MLTSLFGDLGPAEGPDARRGAESGSDSAFAATAIMETVDTQVNARGQMVDRHSQDLVVCGSPAQAIREHFAQTRSDLDTAAALITLIDPARVWASAVIKALSDASGRPIERLHLREHATLRTLATLERTTLIRRDADALRIYHADVRAPGRENDEIPRALMERSQMTVVIAGPLQAHSIDALLQALHAAAMLPTWRCPHLLLILPPNAEWITDKLAAVTWPGRLNVHVTTEPMTSASSVWNAIAEVWVATKAKPAWAGATDSRLMDLDEFPIGAQDDRPVTSASADDMSQSAQTPSRGPSRPDAQRARIALESMLALDGLLGCAVVDASSGQILAGERRGDSRLHVDLKRAAAVGVQVLRAHRQAARYMGWPDQVDEVASSIGPYESLVRSVTTPGGLLLIALFDKHRGNLALARLRLMEVERALA